MSWDVNPAVIFGLTVGRTRWQTCDASCIWAIPRWGWHQRGRFGYLKPSLREDAIVHSTSLICRSDVVQLLSLASANAHDFFYAYLYVGLFHEAEVLDFRFCLLPGLLGSLVSVASSVHVILLHYSAFYRNARYAFLADITSWSFAVSSRRRQKLPRTPWSLQFQVLTGLGEPLVFAYNFRT